jgi:hypothetical protein
MASWRPFAYIVLIAVIAIVPAWGCSSEAPKPPPEAKEAAGQSGTPPTIDLGQGSDDKGSSDEPAKTGDGG